MERKFTQSLLFNCHENWTSARHQSPLPPTYGIQMTPRNGVAQTFLLTDAKSMELEPGPFIQCPQMQLKCFIAINVKFVHTER